MMVEQYPVVTRIIALNIDIRPNEKDKHDHEDGSREDVHTQHGDAAKMERKENKTDHNDPKIIKSG